MQFKSGPLARMKAETHLTWHDSESRGLRNNFFCSHFGCLGCKINSHIDVSNQILPKNIVNLLEMIQSKDADQIPNVKVFKLKPEESVSSAH